MVGSLPYLAYMVSRPRQDSVGENTLPRCDATTRLRDWQHDFGGFTKVYEDVVNGQIKRTYFVVYVIKARSNEENARLCFTCVKCSSEKKPWDRDSGLPDPSRTTFLDLSAMCDW